MKFLNWYLQSELTSSTHNGLKKQLISALHWISNSQLVVIITRNNDESRSVIIYLTQSSISISTLSQMPFVERLPTLTWMIIYLFAHVRHVRLYHHPHEYGVDTSNDEPTSRKTCMFSSDATETSMRPTSCGHGVMSYTGLAIYGCRRPISCCIRRIRWLSILKR